MQNVNNREIAWGGYKGVKGNSLYFPLDFSANLKLL